VSVSCFHLYRKYGTSKPGARTPTSHKQTRGMTNACIRCLADALRQYPYIYIPVIVRNYVGILLELSYTIDTEMYASVIPKTPGDNIGIRVAEK
jgi:hypothetical protein